MVFYSLEIFPSLNAAQSTFPDPTFHSSPRAVQNSVSVKPGGSRLMISLNLGAGSLADPFDPDCAVAFFLAAAFTGRTPPERPLT